MLFSVSVSVCNLLVEADCLRLRLAKFSSIIGCLVELCTVAIQVAAICSEMKNYSFCSIVILETNVHVMSMFDVLDDSIKAAVSNILIIA